MSTPVIVYYNRFVSFPCPHCGFEWRRPLDGVSVPAVGETVLCDNERCAATLLVSQESVA